MSNATATTATTTTERQFCTFLVGGQLFGLDILDVREIVDEPPITPVAHAPAAVSGYVNIRGSIHLVLSLPLLLGSATTEEPKRRRLVVLKQRVVELCALQIDRVGDIVTVPAERIEPARGGGCSAGCRVCHLDRTLLVVLDPARIAHAMGL